MKQITTILLLFLPVLAFAQFPDNPRRIVLGYQTTADGLIYRASGAPAFTPSDAGDTRAYINTDNGDFYVYNGGWILMASGANIDSTRIVQDSIAVYYQGGSEVDRDTIRIIKLADGVTITGTGQTGDPYTVDTLLIATIQAVNDSIAGFGAGDVTGPGSSTDNAIARFDGATGKIIQNSTITIGDAGLMTLNGGNIALNGEWLSGDGGDEGISVDASGKVGIGSGAVPAGSTLLTVTGSGPINNSGLIEVYNNSTSSAVGGFMVYAPNITSGQSIGFNLGKQIVNTDLGAIRFHYTSSNSPLNRMSVGIRGHTDVLSVNANDRIGVNVTDPQETGDFSGDIRIRGGEIGLNQYGSQKLTRGSNSPESVVSANIGSIYRDTLNGDLYIKNSGTGSTGWLSYITNPLTATLQTNGNYINGDSGSEGLLMENDGSGTIEQTTASAVR